MKQKYFLTGLFFTFLFLDCSRSEDNDAGRPTVTTAAISNIVPGSAMSGGTIASEGNAPVSQKGVCWSTAPHPTISDAHTEEGSGNSSFTSTIPALLPDTKYYVRAYATNTSGVGYGNEVNFTTGDLQSPIIMTAAITAVTQISATGGGNITSNGGAQLTESGICYATTANPDINDTKITTTATAGNFSLQMAGLIPNTTYYVRAFATNSTGTAYGAQVSFTTLDISIAGNGMTDVEGHHYTTVILGGKEWIVQNLRTAKYRDGSNIVYAPTNGNWATAPQTGKYCNANGSSSNFAVYGFLYNRYAVLDNRQLAPSGWHVASKDDWDALIAYLGGTQAGKHLKPASGSDTFSNNQGGADNSSGLFVFPGGDRNGSGVFENFLVFSGFWTSDSGANGIYEYLSSNNAAVNTTTSPGNTGYFIRCVKNN